nr:MAG TPA: major capsid protein [Caudoviricetes sp.]
MASLGNKLIIKQGQWTANMTEENHLAANLLLRPERLSTVMERIFSAQNIYSNNPLTSMLSQMKTQEIESPGWDWELKGANTRPLVVVEKVETGSRVGANQRQFSIVLDEDWFMPTDVLTPGTADLRLQCYVQSVEPYGTGYKYTMQLLGNDKNLFVPDKYLDPGQQWSKLFSLGSEAAERRGSTQFSLPIMLHNDMSIATKHYEITNLAANDVLAIGVPDPHTNQTYYYWRYLAESEFHSQFFQEKERVAWMSRSTDMVKDRNNRIVRCGAGLLEQLEGGHVHIYNQLTAKLIEEYLMDIYFGRTKPGQGRNVKAYTGEYGMLTFHRAIQSWMNDNGFIKNVELFTNKEKSQLSPNALGAGYQFVKYYMANGCSLELVHNPLYDDREIFREIDPITGFPTMSQRLTFLDFAEEGGKSNIQMIKKKNGDAFAYVAGTFGPYGPLNGGMAAHGGSYYSMEIESMFGIHVNDVTRCGELIPARA